MAAENRREGSDLSAQLFAAPHRFDFFQAVRLISWISREKAVTDTSWASHPLGEEASPEQEVLRFRSHPSLSFPTSAISRLRSVTRTPGRDRGESEPARKLLDMVVTFLGLTGPNGVLPEHYTTLLLQRIRASDNSMRDFFDLFNHRLISHFFRAWEKYRLPFRLERQAREGGREDLCESLLYCLVGLGTEGLRGRLEIPDPAFLYYSGHFAHAPRSAVVLEAILAHHFRLPIEVHSLVGQWLYLGSENRSQMSGGEGIGQHNRLGVDLIVGRAVWDVQSKFRLRIGPLRYAQFRRLMPNGDMLRAVAHLTRMYAGAEMDFDVQLVLLAAEVPKCRLLGRGDRAFLGWNTWSFSQEMTRDADDAVFVVQGL